MKRVIISGILILTFILIGTLIAVLYARGYRIGQQSGKFIEGTGLLVTTSKPDGARVFINTHLSTATNNTINLSPNDYDVKIEKDGYFPWKKKIVVKKETVAQANALLFPIAPKFAPITTTGAQNVILDATGTLIAYTVSSSSASKNGVYLLNMSSQPIISIGSGITQLTNNIIADFSNAALSFSPDGKELIAQIKSKNSSTFYLLKTTGFNDSPKDITNTLPQVQREWESQKAERNKKLVESLPSKVRAFANDYFSNIFSSVEGEKLLYTASVSGQLPYALKTKIPGSNTTPETREVKQGSLYVYDIKEDLNYLVFENPGNDILPIFLWHPDSRHLVSATDGKVEIVEYDGLNDTTIFAGPFVPNIAIPWPDGSSIVIVTKLNNPSSPDNLYRVGLQ